MIAVAPERGAEVLKSLKKVDYPKKKHEIIVERGRNPSNNRNRGAKKARGEIIAFIDDDALADKNILKKAEEFFEKNEEVDAVGGPQLTPPDERGFAKISGIALSSVFGAWKMSNRYAGKKIKIDADERMLTSANFFCRKKIFKKIKFNPLLFPGEDPDFIARAKRRGFKFAYSPEIIVYHRRRSSYFGLLKQIFSYGKTRHMKETLRETIKMPFFLVPSIFLAYLVFLIILAFLDKINLLILLPLLLYIILNFSFSAVNAIISGEVLALFLLPFVYLSIHLSYGAGFLFSIFRKIIY